MKKSLIALAVAGAFAAPVAMADTTIYGAANVSFDVVNSGSGGATANQVSSGASAIGFKGSEDLGGGTSAIWQVESGLSLDKGGDTWGTNPSFAGLSGADWGSVLLGNLPTPYKSAVRGLDLFADTIADNRSLIGGLAGTKGTATDAIAYMSPSMGGVSIAAAYVAGAETPIAGATKGSAYSLSAMYGAGPINADFAYQSATFGSAGTGTLAGTPNDKATAWELGGGYTMDAFQVNAQYEKLSYKPDNGSSSDQSNWYLAGKFGMGSDAVKLAYTRAGDFSGTSDTGASQISVGYDHTLSKNTTVYALYTQVSNKKFANYGMGGYDGITSVVGAANFDSDPSVWSIGMKHNF